MQGHLGWTCPFPCRFWPIYGRGSPNRKYALVRHLGGHCGNVSRTRPSARSLGAEAVGIFTPFLVGLRSQLCRAGYHMRGWQCHPPPVQSHWPGRRGHGGGMGEPSIPTAGSRLPVGPVPFPLPASLKPPHAFSQPSPPPLRLCPSLSPPAPPPRVAAFPLSFAAAGHVVC